MLIYVSDIQTTLFQNSNSENAFLMKKYMKNKFDFYGIKSPLRKELCKPFLKKEIIPDIAQIEKIIKELWNEPERELQYFAMELLSKYSKDADMRAIDLFEYMITNKSWWDTVDYIAVNLVGKHFLKFPDLILPTTNNWVTSNNIWLQRTSILFQLKYKSKTDLPLLFKYILMHSKSKEFFIRKVIGWALREYSKTDPNAVVNFVNTNELSGLSTREALKRIK